MEERRKAQRLRTYLGGEVEFHPQCSRLECLVRNLSPNGAKLTFPRPAMIPDIFNLTIPQNGDHRNVRLVWRNAREVGVQFEEMAAAPVISLETARRIRAIEVEFKALAERVADLARPD